jgi:3-hydroxyisobutyrate dehydrogenase
MRVAFLGTGTMGAPMVHNLVKAGHEVTAWNRTRERAEHLGAAVAGAPAEAVEGAEAVVTMLADGEAVAAAMGGVRLSGDQVWWQASTVGLEGTERLAGLAGDAAFVDGPVSGTKQPAEQGALVILASGPADARRRLAPVFDAVGSKVVDLGEEAGEATRMKLVLNTWLVALVEGLSETIALAEALGVDPRQFLEVIDGGPLGPPYAKLKGTAMIERRYDTAFSLKLAAKDARLALAAADAAGVELPAIEATRRSMARAIDRGHGEDDMAAAIEGLR